MALFLGDLSHLLQSIGMPLHRTQKAFLFENPIYSFIGQALFLIIDSSRLPLTLQPKALNFSITLTPLQDIKEANVPLLLEKLSSRRYHMTNFLKDTSNCSDIRYLSKHCSERAKQVFFSKRHNKLTIMISKLRMYVICVVVEIENQT